MFDYIAVLESLTDEANIAVPVEILEGLDTNAKGKVIYSMDTRPS